MSLASGVTALASRIAQEVNALRGETSSGLATKAALSHTHAESDVTGLTSDVARVTDLENRNPTDLGHARMVQRGTQSTPNQANALIQFNTVLNTTVHVTHTSTTTFTIVTPGLYLLDAKVGYTNFTNTTCTGWIGTPDFVTARWAEGSVGFTTATFPSLALATTAYLAAGTQVTLGVYNYAALSVSNGYDATHLAVTLLRRA